MLSPDLPGAAEPLRVSILSQGRYLIVSIHTALDDSQMTRLQTELIDRSRWRTQTAARMAVFDYIECFYNPRRRHSALGYLSPAEYERRARLTAA